MINHELPCGNEIRHIYYGLFFCDLPFGHNDGCSSRELIDAMDGDVAEDEPILERRKDW